MLEMLDYRGWVPALIATQAIAGTGVEALWDAILRHQTWLRSTDALADKRSAAFAHRVRQLALGTLEGDVEAEIANLPAGIDPYAAAEAVLRRFGVTAGASALGNVRPGGAVRATVKGL
jgi:putative protein kinase ArgK-like GTPase of G3E family